jgi:hypothetical protein
LFTGLSHMTFIASHLDRMELLLTTVLDARKVYGSGEETFSVSRERFFLVGRHAGDPDAPAPVWIARMKASLCRNGPTITSRSRWRTPTTNDTSSASARLA